MARTINDVYNELLAAKAAQPELNVLTSTSNTAIWRMLLYVVAVVIHSAEVILDNLKGEIEQIKANSYIGSTTWYRDQAFKYQHGYLIELVDGLPGYSTDDPAARIITRGACQPGPDRNVIIKVAKGSTGSLTPLSAAELAGVQAYYDGITLAGVGVSCVSSNADQIRITADVYYDAQIPSTDIVTEAEQLYAELYQQLPFNSQILVSQLVDQLQACTGVVDVHNVVVEVNSGAGWTTVDREFVPVSGYTEMGTGADSLGSTLSFIPNV